MRPVNLYYDARGRTCLRYWALGAPRGRTVAFPAALLTQPPDPEAEVAPRVFASPAEALFGMFRGMPLRPEGGWALAREGFPAVWREAFDAFLRMLRLPPGERWCVRGEPGWFLQFGLREADGAYTMGAFVLPCGRPAVMTFRAEDLIEALPPPRFFAVMDIRSEADGLEAREDEAWPWDTRVRLPIASPGAAIVRLRPRFG